VLFWVWVGACVPFMWVMVVGEGCSGWCVFQYCVAVVSVSRRVPGVVVGFGVWVVCVGVAGLVWACSCVPVWPGVGVLFSGVCVGVAGLVCVSWFRILMCVLSFLSCFWFCFLFVWLITLPGAVGVVLACVLFRVVGCTCGCF